MASGNRQRPRVVGAIKVALSLKHSVIPATLNLREPNPRIAWDDIPVTIGTRTAPWPNHSPSRLARVSGFDITGTNAHVVLESAAAPAPSRGDEECARLFPLSAQSPAALEQRAQLWLERLNTDPLWPASSADLAWTAACSAALVVEGRNGCVTTSKWPLIWIPSSNTRSERQE
jgi:acyl transferase domain-containing protein